MELLIRNECEEDNRAVEEVTREAFWNLYPKEKAHQYSQEIFSIAVRSFLR